MKINIKEQLDRSYVCVQYPDGTKVWYRNGLRHREDGPALEDVWGNKYWYLDGQRHREDGPAVECANGIKNWYRYGLLHREDGPAIEWFDGYKKWYYQDKHIDCHDQETFIRLIKLKAFW